MRQYVDCLKRIMDSGVDRKGRNGMTRARWVEQLRFDLREGFPAVTTKKLFFKAVKGELLWFLQGPTNRGRMDDMELRRMMGSEKTVWTANAESDDWTPHAQFPGDLGRIYGAQWRDWLCPDGHRFDQLGWAINELRTNPSNRRILVTAYNPGEIHEMALPPCHILFHFYAADGVLSMHMLQRSADMFLGVPFNIASYALLQSMVAQVTGLEAGELVITFDDTHIYHEHFEQVAEQLTREPYPLPQLGLNPDVAGIDSFTMDDIELRDYRHHPAITGKMVV